MLSRFPSLDIGRKLNVHMTFNLHPVFRGFECLTVCYRFRNNYLSKNGSHQSCFSRISLTDFRVAIYLKTGLPQRYLGRNLLIDSKTLTEKQFI